jgi:hypothetical protein
MGSLWSRNGWSSRKKWGWSRDARPSPSPTLRSAVDTTLRSAGKERVTGYIKPCSGLVAAGRASKVSDAAEPGGSTASGSRHLVGRWPQAPTSRGWLTEVERNGYTTRLQQGGGSVGLNPYCPNVFQPPASPRRSRAILPARMKRARYPRQAAPDTASAPVQAGAEADRAYLDVRSRLGRGYRRPPWTGGHSPGSVAVALPGT